ncbi:pimeloyl-ACP methyl ester carboxylesterase [Azospirillum fermentarium]|uniref:alpha/beta hydrolase n=1 Tax=Azospirillum fermentarium TaxID=1233114 RepID=UPI00222683FF|nr:alpha/beta hydrolase [Azospirillum fermentarium]MCW2245127.1 pimeloyl-ACP methyl ester carboxylesterase [Azospirillum fermentarium]
MPAAAAETRGAPASDPRLTTAPCWFSVPEGEEATCATLAVPERRDRPQGRMLHLPVAILHATDGPPQPDPVIYVEGGPGASVFGVGEPAEERMEGWWDALAPLRRTRDIVLFDPRGVGRAEPETNCPELDTLAGRSATTPDTKEPDAKEGEEAAERAALTACAQRLQAAGVDLAQFSTPTAADDLADLARAVTAGRGGGKVNLLAVSYGTRVVLELLRRHGATVRAAVLDSVYPPDINAREDEAWLSYRAFRRLFDDCAASRPCRAAFPNLEKRVLDLVPALNRSPMAVAVGDSMVPRTMMLDGRRLLTATLELMAEGDSLARLPLALDRATRGRPERLARDAPPLAIGDPDTAEGMAFSVECRETVNPADPARVATNRQRWAPYGSAGAGDTGQRVCALWPAGVQDAAERLPVASTVPVLLLSGAYDPVTPPEWGERAAATLPNSRHLVFRAAGHGVTATDGCALETAGAFIEQPDPARVIACRSSLQPPRFETR